MSGRLCETKVPQRCLGFQSEQSSPELFGLSNIGRRQTCIWVWGWEKPANDPMAQWERGAPLCQGGVQWSPWCSRAMPQWGSGDKALEALVIIRIVGTRIKHLNLWKVQWIRTKQTVYSQIKTFKRALIWTNAASALMYRGEDGKSQFYGIWQELHTLSSTGMYNSIISLHAG